MIAHIHYPVKDTPFYLALRTSRKCTLLYCAWTRSAMNCQSCAPASAMLLPFMSPQALIMAKCSRSRNPGSWNENPSILPWFNTPVCLTKMASVIHSSGVSSWGGVCGGAKAGATHSPKGVVLLDQAWMQHVVAWATTPEVILQRYSACKNGNAIQCAIIHPYSLKFIHAFIDSLDPLSGQMVYHLPACCLFHCLFIRLHKARVAE